jgi:hypothetical protein
MRLTYETGVATMIQFIVLAFLNIINGVVSIVTTCTSKSGSCTLNAFTSIWLYIMVVCLFAAIAALGYSAQSKRSRKLSIWLICAELVVSAFAAFNIKQGIASHNGALSLFTSLIDLVMAFWIITLAFRLMRSKGARVRRRGHTVHHDNNLLS